MKLYYKAKIKLIATALILFFTLTTSTIKVAAQEQNSKSEIVMTKAELESLLTKIAERRQAKINEDKLIALPNYTMSRPVVYQNQDIAGALNTLQYKLDLLLAQGYNLPKNGNTTTVNVPSNYPNTNYTSGNPINLPATTRLKAQQIFFANNSIALSASDKNAITALIPSIKENQALVVLKGFASKVGSAFYNNQLSYNRANAIKDLLINNGVNPGNIIIMYHGADPTINDKQARRVDISVEKVIIN